MPHVLIAEDEFEIFEIYRDVLDEMGCTSQAAPDGLITFLATNQTKFDLIITDLQMPAVSGQEFIKEILSKDRYKNIPILVLSGQVDDPVFDSYSHLPTISVMAKPFRVDELKNKIATMLGMKKK